MEDAIAPDESRVPTRNRTKTRQAIAIALGGLGVAGIIVGTLPAHAAGGYEVIVEPRLGVQSFSWAHDGQVQCVEVAGGPQSITPTTGAGDQWTFDIFSEPACKGFLWSSVLQAAPDGETGEWIVYL